MEHIPFVLAKIDTNSLPQSIKTFYLITYEIFIIAVMCLIFNKKLKTDFIDILKKDL